MRRGVISQLTAYQHAETRNPEIRKVVPPKAMVHKCLSRQTEDGHLCQQDVIGYRTHCESGHRCAWWSPPDGAVLDMTSRLGAVAMRNSLDTSSIVAPESYTTDELADLSIRVQMHNEQVLSSPLPGNQGKVLDPAQAEQRHPALPTKSNPIEFTSPSGAFFKTNRYGNFTVKTAFRGSPPLITIEGKVPSDIHLSPRGPSWPGELDLWGTPHEKSAGTYPLKIKAENELGFVIQNFAIVVSNGPTPHAGPNALTLASAHAPIDSKGTTRGGKTTLFTQYAPKPRSTEEMKVIASKLKDKVITLDMDGSIYDPWACCQKADWSWVGTEKCRHLRQDVLDEVLILAAETGASVVALSWRSGGDEPTREWLKHVGLELDAIFIPGAQDDLCGFAGDHKGSYGQIGFKTSTVVALRALGKDVIACFDDRTAVCRQLKDIGVPDVRQVKHLVEPLPHEYTAGYIGAPKPALGAYTHYGYGYDHGYRGTTSGGTADSNWWLGGQGSLLERHDAAFGSGVSQHGSKGAKHSDSDYDPAAYKVPGLTIDNQTGMTHSEALARYERAMADIDPSDPEFDPDEEIDMSDILGDPDAPPMRLHEILDSDSFWTEDADIALQKRGSRRRDLRHPSTCPVCQCGVDEDGDYMHESWCSALMESRLN